MKIPNIFILEKDLEGKTLQLKKGAKSKSLSLDEVEKYYDDYVGSKYFKKVSHYGSSKDPFDIENIKGYYKKMSYEELLMIIKYAECEKERLRIARDKFLEGLADLP